MPGSGRGDDGDRRVVTVLLDVMGVEVPVGVVEDWQHPDVDQVDALARLALEARRRGCSVKLRGPCGRMVELLDLLGLCGLVHTEDRADADAEGERRAVDPSRKAARRPPPPA